MSCIFATTHYCNKKVDTLLEFRLSVTLIGPWISLRSSLTKELEADQKDSFRARETRKKAIEEMSEEAKAAHEKIRFYKFYPVQTPEMPDISQVKYMEHDLTGLLSSPDVNFTEPQILADKSSDLLDFHLEFVSLELASKIQLKSLAEEMQAIIKRLEKVGEDHVRCPFEQAIATLLNFVRLFQKAHEENYKQAELEKKKIAAENEKSKAHTRQSGNN